MISIIEDAITQRLIQDEGEVLHAYQDHLGFWTIGVGVLIDERKGGGITQEESRYLLRNRMRRCETQCAEVFEWWQKIDEVRRAAIICMSYQLGVGGVAEFKKMGQALGVLDYNTAAAEALDSTWAKQTPARAQRMARIIRTGKWE